MICTGTAAGSVCVSSGSADVTAEIQTAIASANAQRKVRKFLVIQRIMICLLCDETGRVGVFRAGLVYLVCHVDAKMPSKCFPAAQGSAGGVLYQHVQLKWRPSLPRRQLQWHRWFLICPTQLDDAVPFGVRGCGSIFRLQIEAVHKPRQRFLN